VSECTDTDIYTYGMSSSCLFVLLWGELSHPVPSFHLTSLHPLPLHLPPPPSPFLHLSLSRPFFIFYRRGYLVAAPSVFRAGVEESVSVTIFNAKAETRVQVQLTAKGQTVAHGHVSVLGENKATRGLRRQRRASPLGGRTCTNKSSYETPPPTLPHPLCCDLLKGCRDHTGTRVD